MVTLLLTMFNSVSKKKVSYKTLGRYEKPILIFTQISIQTVYLRKIEENE